MSVDTSPDTNVIIEERDMHEFYRHLAAHHGVFTRAEALRFGVTKSQLAGMVRREEVTAMYPRTFRIESSPATWHARLRGAALSVDGVASHRAAGVLWGIDGFAPTFPEVTIPESRCVSLPNVKVHRTRQYDRVDETERHGVAVTGIGRTVLDLAAVVGAHKLNLVLDSVIRQRLVEWPDLYLVLVRHSRQGRTGCGRLRKVLDVRYGESAIPDSTWNRNVGTLLGDAGLPDPVFEHEISAGGQLIARVDLAYPWLKVAIELDSVRWHHNIESFRRDPRRKNKLTLLGWTVLTFTWSDFVDTPDALVGAVRQALAVARSSKAWDR